MHIFGTKQNGCSEHCNLYFSWLLVDCGWEIAEELFGG